MYAMTMLADLRKVSVLVPCWAMQLVSNRHTVDITPRNIANQKKEIQIRVVKQGATWIGPWRSAPALGPPF